APVDVLHVALVGSTVPKGRIAALDTRAAQKAAGVRAVITHLNAPRLPYRPFDERPEVDPSVGEPLRVFQGPEVRFSGQPIAAVALWEGERLTLWDKTQWVNNDAVEIAHVFGLPDDHVRVICPYVGGAFGSGLRTWPHVTIAALAARLVGRPVRVELTRREL